LLLLRCFLSTAAPPQITLIEANELLGSFDARLREYAARNLVKAGVQLLKGVVKQVRETEIELQVGGFL
jgi:NADH:ubiquinone reductase (non-electrogenic)